MENRRLRDACLPIARGLTSEPIPNLHLNAAHIHGVGRRSEPGGSWRQTRGIDLAIPQRLRVADGQVRRADELDFVLPFRDDNRIECVEQVEAEFHTLIASNANVAR